jgi:hypothetical protein
MIREYEPRDRKEIERIHDASGFDYRFPDIDDPLYLVKLVAEENGKVVESLCCKLVLNINLYVDSKAGTPQYRWEILKKLVESAKKKAWACGLDEAYAMVPKEIEKQFAKRLKKLGMTKDRDGWCKWQIDLTEYTPSP